MSLLTQDLPLALLRPGVLSYMEVLPFYLLTYLPQLCCVMLVGYLNITCFTWYKGPLESLAISGKL